MSHLAPIGPDHKTRDDVGEKRERQPLQNAGNLVVTALHRGHSDGEPEQNNKVVRVYAGQHFGRVSHSREISADVNGVGGEQAQRRDHDKGFREFLAQSASESHAGDHSDTRAHHLHARHQWPRDERSPKLTGAQESARRRIGRNSRRIIIGRASNQARTKVREKPDD